MSSTEKIDTNKLPSNISERAKNVLFNANIHSLEDLDKFISQGGEIDKLRNCGSKTAEEIRSLSDSKPNDSFEDLSKALELSFQRVKNDKIKFEILITKVQTNYEELKVRSKNTLHKIIENDNSEFDFLKLIEIILSKNIDFEKVPAAGKKTISELEKFRENLFHLLKDIDEKEIDEIDLEIYKLEQKITLTENEKKEIRTSLSLRRLDIIDFFEKYILEKEVFEKLESDLLILYINFDSNTNISSELERIAKRHKLTRERVRQIYVKLTNQSGTKLEFLKGYIKFLPEVYNNLIQDGFVNLQNYVPNTTVRFEVRRDAVGVSNLFSLILNKEFYVTTEHLKLDSHRQVYNQNLYKNFKHVKAKYIIEKRALGEDLLLKGLNLIFKLLVYKIPEDITVLSTDIKPSINSSEFHIIKEVVRSNFSLEATTDEIHVPRNTYLNLIDLIKIWLKDKDEIMSATEIFNGINQRWPGKCKTENSIRSMLQKSDFVYLRGITDKGESKYGLREWVQEKGLLIGSIKELAINYLSEHDRPVHILELYRHIKKHRSTSQHNLLGNLKLGTKGRFKFYKAGFIGLPDKQYDQNFIKKLKNINPQASTKMAGFIKNHISYDYEAFVKKFTQELDLLPIQIEQVIESRKEEGIFRVQGEKIFYNLINEDLIIEDFTRNSSLEMKSIGYNPYRIEIDNYVVVTYLEIVNNSTIHVNDEKIKFRDYDLKLSDGKMLLYYHQSKKTYLCILCPKQSSFEKINNLTLNFNLETEVLKSKIEEDFIQISFSTENMKGIGIILKNIIKSGFQLKMEDETSLFTKLQNLDLSNLPKLKAIALITKEAELRYDLTVDLTEAKNIYEKLKLS